MPCPFCGSETVASARFCQACGRALDPDLTLSAEDQTTRLAGAGGASDGSSGWLTSSDSISHGRFAPGAVLDGRYRIIGLLGQGGMGEVYRADDLRLGQPVALKFLPDTVSHDAKRLAQFHNEVRAARQVAHPNICRVYDIGESAGHLFLSMELVAGEDLAASLRRIGRFPEDKALDIARQLCAGLAAAHERGVLHRDLKPANVMLDAGGKVRLMDFGLAAIGADDGLRAGTPGYMAPEQLRGQDATPASDIYALGLVLYEVFTGRRAFTASTLQALSAQQQLGKLTPPSTIVTSLDPAIERAILRCLDPDAERRPASPLTVSASLPGGDPLAAALAAGETPSPEMVAASGRGAGLTRSTAAALLTIVLAGTVTSYLLSLRDSALEQLRPQLSADVLAQKAREAATALGYDASSADEAYAFAWNQELIAHVGETEPQPVQWNDVARRHPSMLTFWYRRSQSPMAGSQFHHDLLTPGIVTPDDPPPLASGMVALELDHRGRLLAFEAIPPQVEETSSSGTSVVDWAPLLTLAGLDPAKLKTEAPSWNWLSSPDIRAAWTGTWPDGDETLRVEAAGRLGRPVAFRMIGAWTKPVRQMPDTNSSSEIAFVSVLFGLCLAVIVGGGVLARRNLREGRGDRVAAMRLAAAVVVALWLLWVCQVHVTASVGMIGVFLIAVFTTVSYGVLFWAVYLALEPFVRRHWPQTLVSWTTLLGGRVRDPIVGRDVLIGAAVGVATALTVRFSGELALGDSELLQGGRAAAGKLVSLTIYSVRSGLLIFYLLFLLKALLRNQWAAAAALTILFAGLSLAEHPRPIVAGVTTALYFGLLAVAVLRWGLTSLVVAFIVANLLLTLPATTDRSAWFLGATMLVGALPLAVAAWAFFASAPAEHARRPGMFEA